MSVGQIKIDSGKKWLLDAAMQSLERTWREVEADEVTASTKKMILKEIKEFKKILSESVKV
jgi:hypothetical protein